MLSTKKAPGAIPITTQFVHHAGVTFTSRMVPNPKNSLMIERRSSVYPKAIPEENASSIE